MFLIPIIAISTSFFVSIYLNTKFSRDMSTITVVSVHFTVVRNSTGASLNSIGTVMFCIDILDFLLGQQQNLFDNIEINTMKYYSPWGVVVGWSKHNIFVRQWRADIKWHCLQSFLFINQNLNTFIPE